MDQPTIARLCLECETALNDTFEAAGRTDFQNDQFVATMRDELGRFRIWASTIGALNSGTASLDDSLQDVKYLHQNVKSLLEDLKRSTSEGFAQQHWPRLTC